jgi:hypothetical protein
MTQVNTWGCEVGKKKSQDMFRANYLQILLDRSLGEWKGYGWKDSLKPRGWQDWTFWSNCESTRKFWPEKQGNWNDPRDHTQLQVRKLGGNGKVAQEQIFSNALHKEMPSRIPDEEAPWLLVSTKIHIDLRQCFKGETKAVCYTSRRMQAKLLLGLLFAFPVSISHHSLVLQQDIKKASEGAVSLTEAATMPFPLFQGIIPTKCSTLSLSPVYLPFNV